MTEQYIKRSPKGKENPYRMIDRRIMEDDRLSFESRGALAYILVKPDNWQVSITNLMNAGNIGKEKAYRIVKEWIDCGYCERVEHREKGKVTGYTYYIHEEPLPVLPLPAEPLPALPLPALPLPALPLPVNQYYNNKEVCSKEEVEVKKNSSRAKATASQPHPETQAILTAYVEARGKNGINYQKEGTFAKKIAKDGYNPTQAKGCYLWLKSQDWWEDKTVTLATIFKSMPEYVKWAERQGIDTTTSSSGEATVIDVDWSAP